MYGICTDMEALYGISHDFHLRTALVLVMYVRANFSAPTEEHSAEVEIPRSLFAEVQHLVQADELAVLVLLTAGAPQLPRRSGGTKWAEVLGCGSTVVGILDKLRKMSPQLVIEERQFRSVLAKIEDARRSKSTDRPRIVDGVRWTPKELACVHVDAAAASPG